MPAISRRKHPFWRASLIITVLSLVRHCESMSARRLTELSPLFSSFADSKRQDLGSPNDLSRHFMDSQTEVHPNTNSVAVHRSVFVAPLLPSCADGYEADAMGRCVKKHVNIDHKVHLDFLLDRLNNRFANRGRPEASNNKWKVSNEPLQLNVPLIVATDINSFRVDYKEIKDSIGIPVGIAPRQYSSSKE